MGRIYIRGEINPLLNESGKKMNIEKMAKAIENGFKLFATTVTRNSSVAEAVKVFIRTGEASIGKTIVKDGADTFYAKDKGKKANPREGGWAFSRGLEILKRFKIVEASDGETGTIYATEIGRAIVAILDERVTAKEVLNLVEKAEKRTAKKVTTSKGKKAKTA